MGKSTYACAYMCPYSSRLNITAKDVKKSCRLALAYNLKQVARVLLKQLYAEGIS